MPNLVLCSKEDADNYLMHFRTKGSKNGVRLYQYKDGSLTPLGRIHYGIGLGRKKGATEKQPIEKQTTEMQYEYAAYKAYKDKKIMSQITKILDRSDDPDIKEFKELGRALKYEDVDFNRMYDKYMNQMEKDRGKPWGGDGSEAHEEMLERYPEYKAHNDRLEAMIHDYVSMTKKIAKKPEFANIKGLDASSGYEEVYETWVNEADEKAYPIAMAAYSGYNIFPEHFIEWHSKDGKQSGMHPYFPEMGQKELKAKYANLREEFDNGSEEVKKRIGTQLLAGGGVDFDTATWLGNKVDDVVHHDTNNETTTIRDPKIKKEYDKYENSKNNMTDRANELLRQSNHRPGSGKNTKTYKEFQKLLKDDSVYQAMREAWKKSRNGYLNIVLKKLGFDATADNRSMIYPYVIFEDWD